MVLDVDGAPARCATRELGPGKVQVEFSRPGTAGDDLTDETTDEDEGEDA